MKGDKNILKNKKHNNYLPILFQIDRLIGQSLTPKLTQPHNPITNWPIANIEPFFNSFNIETTGINKVACYSIFMLKDPLFSVSNKPGFQDLILLALCGALFMTRCYLTDCERSLCGYEVYEFGFKVLVLCFKCESFLKMCFVLCR